MREFETSGRPGNPLTYADANPIGCLPEDNTKCPCCGQQKRVSYSAVTDEAICWNCGLVDTVDWFTINPTPTTEVDIAFDDAHGGRGKIKLWLDDIRDPKDYGLLNWTWVKTAEEAIEVLQSGLVVEASLDHDLSLEATMGQPKEGEATGYTVLCWIEEHEAWPPRGLKVHTMNPSAGRKMMQVVQKHYGREGNEFFGPPPKIKIEKSETTHSDGGLSEYIEKRLSDNLETDGGSSPYPTD